MRECKHLEHKHGGKIVAIAAIGHDTIEGVGDWYYVGTVDFDGDGHRSVNVVIPAWALCYDGTEEGRAEWASLSKLLIDYLNDAGTWHDDRCTRKGRCYWWTPHKPTGRVEVAEVTQ